MQVFFQHKKCRPSQPMVGWESLLWIPSVLCIGLWMETYWPVLVVLTFSWEFWFLGQVLKTAPVLMKTVFFHSDNCLGFQKLKKIWLSGFQVQQFSKNFEWSVLRDSSHTNHGFFLLCIYFFLVFLCFSSHNQYFFCAKFRIVAKSENNLWQAEKFFFSKKFTKKVGKKALCATFKLTMCF
jgi:hypothetical protein